MKVSARIIHMPGMAMEAGSAVPRQGPLQGVATTVTKRPWKKEPVRPPLLCRFCPAPVALTPISKRPNMLRPRVMSSSTRM